MVTATHSASSRAGERHEEREKTDHSSRSLSVSTCQALLVAPLGSGAAYAEFFRQVEALGLDAVWTEDRPSYANMLDSVMLWRAAANTRRIQLGTAVMVLNLRHAAVVAWQACTVSSPHRRTAGSRRLPGRPPNEYQGLGVPIEKRVAVFRGGASRCCGNCSPGSRWSTGADLPAAGRRSGRAQKSPSTPAAEPKGTAPRRGIG